MTKRALPLTASVVIQRVKQGGDLRGHRILEFERYYVRAVPGGRWEACRYAAIETPLRLTTGEAAIVQNLGQPGKTPQDAARRMWKFATERAAAEGVWLVDDDLPEALRAGVNLMPLEKAFAIHDAIAMSRSAGIDAGTFMERHATRERAASEPDIWRIFRGRVCVGDFGGGNEDEAVDVAVRAGATKRGERGLRVVRRDLARLFAAAEAHGEQSEPEHEIGDLQGYVQSAWDVLTSSQRREVYGAHGPETSDLASFGTLMSHASGSRHEAATLRAILITCWALLPRAQRRAVYERHAADVAEWLPEGA
jgi:hypothetical protein